METRFQLSLINKEYIKLDSVCIACSLDDDRGQGTWKDDMPCAHLTPFLEPHLSFNTLTIAIISEKEQHSLDFVLPEMPPQDDWPQCD